MSRSSTAITQLIRDLRTITAVAAGRLLLVLASERVRRTAGYASMCVGLALQVGLCLVTMYLIDLSLSLFELWTLLARKHLELTI